MTENKVLAIVNGKQIFESDVYDLMSGIEDRERFSSPEGFNILADEVVNQELILADAKKRGVDKEEEFQAELQKVYDNMLKNYAMHKIFMEVSVDEDELRKYYENNKETLFSPTNYTASHILIEDLDQATKVKEEIDGGLDFADAARKYSIDPSAQNGGSLGTFPKGVMVEEFQRGLESLNVGEISDPVQSQFGYHLIKLDDITTEDVNYDEIKDRVQATYEMLKRQEKYLETVEEIAKDSEVKKYY